MKPYIICYMMTSIDGRIDCQMTAQLQGVAQYYQILDELDLPTTLSGRTTAEFEMACQVNLNLKMILNTTKKIFQKKRCARI